MEHNEGDLYETIAHYIWVIVGTCMFLCVIKEIM